MKTNPHTKAFMEAFPFEGLTYDDVSLVLQYADFLPDTTDLSTRLTSRIRVNIPFLSAAMDTVTEAPMAIAMAMLGGIGVILLFQLHQALHERVLKVEGYLRMVGIVVCHITLCFLVFLSVLPCFYVQPRLRT